MNATQSRDQYERYVRSNGIAPTSMHSHNCQGGRTVLASYPAQDGGVMGCTCGATERFAAEFKAAQK